MTSYLDFYHYTSKEGKNAIVKSGVIKQSGGGKDAVFGEGVYGTTLSPEAGRDYLAKNNWDDGITPTPAMLRKLNWVIKIRIQRNELKKAPGPRNIFIFDGDLWLENYVWEAIMVKDSVCIIL